MWTPSSRPEINLSRANNTPIPVGEEKNLSEDAQNHVQSLCADLCRIVCYKVVDKWRDIILKYFEDNHKFNPTVEAFANSANKRFPKFYKAAFKVFWSEPLWIHPPFAVFKEILANINADQAKAILISPN